jgi:transcriptional regulator with XRE-family HTH domain
MGSPAATRWQPNERLRAQRLRRAWSLADVVRELCDLAGRLGERPLGVNVTMVYNWETGRHRPRPPYPRLLCLLYECSAEELGLWERPESASRALLVAWLSLHRALPVAGQNVHYG